MKYSIVLIPFPFDDLSSHKVRPAICLTDPIGAHRHIIVAFITSKILPTPLSSDLVLHSADPAFNSTGLHVSSTIRLHRMTTLTTRIIRRSLGTLAPTHQTLVGQKLHALFQLTSP